MATLKYCKYSKHYLLQVHKVTNLCARYINDPKLHVLGIGMLFPTISRQTSGLSQQEQQHNGPFSKGPLCRDKNDRVTAVLVTFSIDALVDVGLSSNFKLISAFPTCWYECRAGWWSKLLRDAKNKLYLFIKSFFFFHVLRNILLSSLNLIFAA